MSDLDLTISGTGRMSWKGTDLSWSLVFDDGAQLTPSDMKAFAQGTSDGRRVCKWTREGGFEVEVRWWAEGDRLCGTIGWEGGSKRRAIAEVRFPVATMPMPRDGQVFSPRGQGSLTKKLDDKRQRPDGLLVRNVTPTLQFSALLGPEGSYYFDQRDTAFHIKAHEYRAVEDYAKVRYSGIHPLPLDGESCVRYTIPYSSSLAFFQGGWFEAAQRYKPWARQQWWAKRPPVDPRLRDIGMWLWNRGKAEDVISPVEKLQQDAGVPMALDWYWWHQHGYDTSYPEYWPPREGLPAFKKALARLGEQNIFTQVYLNGMTWDMDANHWNEGGEQSAVVNPDGSVKAVMFNVFAKRRLAWMCGGGNQPFRDKIGETVGNLRQAGLPGVYLDMIGCTSYEPCHNKAHAHAPGGGNYQVMGYRKMLEDIRKANPGLPLSTEEPNEAYMDLFDSTITLSSGQERLWGDRTFGEHVPAFNAVYHGLVAGFGNYALPDSIPPFDPKWPEQAVWKDEKPWHQLYPDQFFFELARTVVWGLQPTVANFKLRHCSDPEFAELYAFLLKTARFYHAHRDFLFDGDMLSPGTLRTKEIEVDFLSRFIFTVEGQQQVFRERMPALLHSLWKAPDGRVGLVVANYSQDKQDFTLESDGLKAAGEVPRRSWLLAELCS